MLSYRIKTIPNLLRRPEGALFVGIVLLALSAAAEAPRSILEIHSREGKIYFFSEQTPLQTVLDRLDSAYQIQITGLEDRALDPVTFSTAAETLEALIRGLMRYLAVKNFAVEDTDGKPTRVSIFPEARQTVSLAGPSPSPSELDRNTVKPPEEPNRAVVIQSVISDSQAQASGLMQGDIISEYDGIKISRAAELVKESKKRSADDPVEMVVIREGEPVRVQINGGFIGVRIRTVNLPGQAEERP